MKKIIYIITTSDISYQQPLIRTATSLQEAGYNVRMIGRKLKDSIPITDYTFQHKRIRCLFNKKWIFYVEFNLRVFFYLLFRKQHAVCAVDLDTALPVLFISRLKNIPRIFDAREFFTEMKTVIDRPLVLKWWKRIERYCMPKFRFGYAVSTGIANEIHKRFGVNYIIIRNVPVLKSNAEEIQNDNTEPYILYQGYVHQGRALEELIGAMTEIQMTLIICGNGNLFENCVNLVKQLRLENKVIFKGLIPPDQLSAYTENAFVGINLVERSGLNQYYSLPNKFFDYIHASLPQVTMNFPEYKQINEQFEVALLIDNIRPDTIAKKIKILINDKEFYSKLKANCAAARKVLNWQNEEKKLLELYQKMLH